jgi:hypothetical protein
MEPYFISVTWLTSASSIKMISQYLVEALYSKAAIEEVLAYSDIMERDITKITSRSVKSALSENNGNIFHISTKRL